MKQLEDAITGVDPFISMPLRFNLRYTPNKEPLKTKTMTNYTYCSILYTSRGLCC